MHSASRVVIAMPRSAAPKAAPKPMAFLTEQMLGAEQVRYGWDITNAPQGARVRRGVQGNYIEDGLDLEHLTHVEIDIKRDGSSGKGHATMTLQTRSKDGNGSSKTEGEVTLPKGADLQTLAKILVDAPVEIKGNQIDLIKSDTPALNIRVRLGKP